MTSTVATPDAWVLRTVLESASKETGIVTDVQAEYH